MNSFISEAPIIISIVTGILFMLIVYLFVARKNSKTAPYVRFSETGEDDVYLKYAAQAAKALAPSIPPQLLRQKPTARERLERKLNRAGNPWKVTTIEFIVLKYTFMIGGIIIGFGLYWALSDVTDVIPWFGYPILCGLFGFSLPDLQYQSSANARVLAFKKELPEALDMLVISTSAGSAFKQALREIAPLLNEGVVKEEFMRVNKDIDAGNTTVGALENMAKRAPNADTEAFLKAVRQAEEYGSSADITQTLRARAEANREEYNAFVENKIAKLSSHMMAILAPTLIGSLIILCLAPTIALISTYGLF